VVLVRGLAQPVCQDLRRKRLGAEVMAHTVMMLVTDGDADLAKLAGWR
jgi:hypothetical protein